VVLGVVSLGMLSGFTLNASSCCEKDFCSNLRTLEGYINKGYEECCNKSNETQEACFDKFNDKTDESYELLIAAKVACETGDDSLARDLMNRLRDIWLPLPKPRAGGRAENTILALGRRDWIELSATLTRAAAATPVSLAFVEGVYVNSQAAGPAAEASVAAGVTGEASPTVVAATADHAFQSSIYTLPGSTRMNLRFGDEFTYISLTGSVSIAPTAPFPGQGTAQIGVPTSMQLRAFYLGQDVHLRMDPASPFNSVIVDEQGKGLLCVVLTLSSNSSYFAGNIYNGASLYFEFPLTVAQDWSTVTIVADRTIPGSEMTPTEEILLGADLDFNLPSLPTDRCADEDGNKIRDGAEAVNNAMRVGAGCTATH
jgi:hypothetical protein